MVRGVGAAGGAAGGRGSFEGVMEIGGGQLSEPWDGNVT